MKQEVEREIAEALQNAGYSRLGGRVFKAHWSNSAIDHFVYLRWLEKYRPSVSVEIGVRHREAQDFAAAMRRRFGPFPLRGLVDLGAVDENGCLLIVNLGRLCSWPFPWALDPAELGVGVCIREVSNCLSGKLIPLTKEVRDDPSMYEFLTQMRIEALWPTDGAARAAEAIFIGKRLKYSRDRVISDINPFLHSIPSQIDETITAEEFLDRVWVSA